VNNFQGITQHQFLTDESLFGSINPKGKSWNAWNTVFKGSDGEKLTKAEAKIWQQITGRKPPRKDFSPSIEIDLIGRQGGKSLSAARRVLKEAFTGDYQRSLVPGERAYVIIISVNLRSTRVVMDYIKGCLEASPHLAGEVEHQTKNEIHLRNRITIAAYPSSNISVRGLRVCALVLDEASFFRSEGTVTDLEVFRSIRPAMASFENAKTYIISSPWTKSGLVYDFYRDHYGKESKDILIVKAPSILMNPTLNKAFLKREQQRDPVAFAREFLAEFGEGSMEFLPLEAIDGCTDFGLYKRPYDPKNRYRCGVDGSGGRAEFFAFSLVHKTKDGYEVDVVDGWNRTKPETCVERICKVLQEYKVRQVVGDKYSASWIQDAFERRGVKYKTAEKTKSEYLLELAPEILQGTVRLVENKVLLKELRMLERKSSPQGKDVVSHPPGGGHTDDYSNAVAIAVFHSKKKQYDPRGLTFANTKEHFPDQFANRGGGMPRTRHPSGWGYEF